VLDPHRDDFVAVGAYRRPTERHLAAGLKSRIGRSYVEQHVADWLFLFIVPSEMNMGEIPR